MMLVVLTLCGWSPVPLQSSKSHEYPLKQMRNLRAGEHQRSKLLCKVVHGRILKTDQSMDRLAGVNRRDTTQFALLPYAIVTYDYRKKQSP